MGDVSDLVSEDRRRALEALLGKSEQHTPKKSRKYGKSLRRAVPRDVLASWVVSSGRPDPVELILSQDKDRVQELVPVRHERMSVSAFTFYRGAALIMASDLSTLPTTGIEVQVCGDAHISNFGLYSSPERRTVFDINDFDETTRGPWEWDVARLVASVEICGRNRGFSQERREKAVLAAANGDRKRAKKILNKTKAKDSTRAVAKFTEVVDGHLRVKSDPPVIIPLRDIVEGAGAQIPKDLDMAKLISSVLAKYRKTLPPERAVLIDGYRGADIAHKVVGVGSVGTRAWIVVMEGANEHDSLVLQIKEASSSVLERYVGKAPQANHGQRVVEGQHAMQTVSDPLLGWTRMPMGMDGRSHDYYVRQLWDGKGSIDLDLISGKHLTYLARLPMPMRARETVLPLRRTWERATCSIRRHAPLPAPTPIKTRRTTKAL